MPKGENLMSSINSMADDLRRILNEYSTLASTEMKDAVKTAADSAKGEIESDAPRRTGKYAKSWAVKKTKEKTNAIEFTVHSKNQYQLTHLLEFGHALRNGGRTQGVSHIAPAETNAEKTLEYEIKKRLEAIK